jgi:hypothetical protein
MARSRKPARQAAPGLAAFVGETLYLVRRVYEGGWESIFCNSAAAECPGWHEWGGPVKAFTRRGQADALCAELGRKLLDSTNPFRAQGESLADLTSLPPGPFRDWLVDVGLTPPPAGKDGLADWARWWEKHRRGMGAEQRDRVLAGLDKLRFYDVAELEPPAEAATGRPARQAAKGASWVDVFTVELLEWKDDDDFLADQGGGWMKSVEPCISPRGGIYLATFRDPGRAAAYRDELRGQIPQQYREFFGEGFGVAEHRVEVDG